MLILPKEFYKSPKNPMTIPSKNKNLLESGFEMGRVSKRDNIKISADIAARIPMIANAESLMHCPRIFKENNRIDAEYDIELTEGYPSNYENSTPNWRLRI